MNRILDHFRERNKDEFDYIVLWAVIYGRKTEVLEFIMVVGATEWAFFIWDGVKTTRGVDIFDKIINSGGMTIS